MGVRGLESFVEKCPEAFYPVDIRKLAARARRIRRNEKDVPPTVIVDLLACERSFYGNLDVLCGGQGLQYVEQLRSFTSAFESADIRLIFVRDGVSLDRKRLTRNSRKYERVGKTIYKVLDTLERKQLPTDVQWKSRGVPEDIAVDRSLFSQERFEVSSIGCNFTSSEILSHVLRQEVVVAGKGKDADQVISEMACDESLNVFAILSQDSDFLIYQYPKTVHYLSAKHFDYRTLYADGKTLRTYEYDRVGLARHLGLEFGHLPLFATLKGHDLISPTELTDFLNKLIGNWPNEKVDHQKAICAVAKFIRTEKLKPGVDISTKCLGNLAKKIFGDEKRSSDLRVCIADYFMCRTDSHETIELNNFERDNDWLELVSLFPENEQTRNLMLGHPLGSTCLYEDYRKSELPLHAASFARFRQRVYGVLFFEKSGALSEPDRKEFILGIPELCMTGLGSLEKEVVQRIEMPPAIHPGLNNLVRGEDPELISIRWQIFAHIVSPDLNPDLLKMVGEDFLYPVCQLRILQHDLDIPALYGWEIKVIFIHHLRYQRMTNTEKKAVKLQRVPTPRSVQIATLMTNTEVPLAASLVPGLIRMVKILPILNFNGFVFQNLYSECGGCVEKISSQDELETIQKYYDVATSNGKRIRENFDELDSFKNLSIGETCFSYRVKKASSPFMVRDFFNSCPKSKS